MQSLNKVSVGLVFITATLVSDAIVAAAADTSSPGAKMEEITEAAIAGNQFGFDLFARLRLQEGNLFFSPYGISTAMAMAHAGARGQTQDQMARTFHWGSSSGQAGLWSGAQVAQFMGALIRDQSRRSSQGDYEWTVANALWGQKDIAFAADFLKTIKTEYTGGLKLTDFVADPEGARLTINSWVRDQTHEKIQDIIPSRVLGKDTRLVLTNAVYFKGNWMNPFSKTATAPAHFHLISGQDVNVPMMNRTGNYAYAETRQLQILELSYKGKELSMLILLPRNPNGLGEVEKSLANDTVTSYVHQLGDREVDTTIPKFTLNCEFGVAEMLVAMGMTDAFNRTAADFAGMTDKRDQRLYISAVLHKAFVAVDEEGTEAAAATAVPFAPGFNIDLSKKPHIRFNADHPFVFIIRDNVSGSILFVGRLADPGRGS
jgi:serpin B